MKTTPTTTKPAEGAQSVYRKYTHHINLDERGGYYADVRDEDGNTVFEIKAGNELGEDESSIFDDVFMSDKNDMGGLIDYLIDLGVVPNGSSITNSR